MKTDIEIAQESSFTYKESVTMEAAKSKDAAVMPEVIDPPMTRQMRRHG